MKTLVAGIVGLIVGAIVGTLAAVAFGRHDDRGLVMPLWMREGL